MERTSISDLYPDVNNFRAMDIVTVRHMLDDRTREVKLKLRDNIKKERCIETQLMGAYDKIYDNCVEKINEAISFKKTDTIYKIPYVWKDFNNYSTRDCMNYIVSKLKRENIFCTTLGDSLFITWAHVK